jgi:hypothetical protein
MLKSLRSMIISSMSFCHFQLSLVTLATATAKETNNLRKFCPDAQVDFWACMNKTLESIERGSSWIGRSCCKQAVLPKCQQGKFNFHLSSTYCISIHLKKSIKVVQYQHQRLNSSHIVVKVMNLRFTHASAISKATTNAVPMQKLTTVSNSVSGWCLTRRAIQL